MSEAAEAFRRSLESSQEFARRMDQDGFPLAEFMAVQDWQRNRIRVTYADFAASRSDRPAFEFFLQELYGGFEFRDRDEDVGRVQPLMARLLPDKALLALGEAFNLQRLSLDLDLLLAEGLRQSGQPRLDDNLYTGIYRAAGCRRQRERQIGMIRTLGHELRSLTRTPVLLTLLKAVRRPAVLAGYGSLQEFLEKGLASFRQLRDPEYFVETIYQRESRLMRQWFAVDGDGVAIAVSS